MQEIRYLIGLMLCCWSLFSVAATINEIRYEGNDVTQASLLNREIYIKKGDVVDDVLIEKSRQAIMDLGLFKTVSFYLKNTQAERVNDEEVLVDVLFVLEEKYFIIVLPRLKIDDNEIYYGLQLNWDNVAGINHRMRVLFQNRGVSDGIQETRNLFRYSYPNVNGSTYNIGVHVEESNRVDETEGVINRQDEIYGLTLSRWLNSQGRNRGWFVGGGVTYQYRDNDVIVGAELSGKIDTVIMGFETGYVSVSDYEYNRGGKSYGYKLDWSHESIGSEDFFVRHYLYYKSYYRFYDYPLSNLNVQTVLGHANNYILGASAFTLGSRNDLRGYENDRFSGNTMLLTNVEYMFPHDDYPIIRYVGFVDIGNTYDRLSDVFHKPLNLGVGVGLRWKIRAFVNLDLRADFGYGVTDSDYKFTFGTRNMF